MLKILHIIDSEGVYGAEMMLLDLIAEHRRMGLQAEIASIGTKGCAPKALETEADRRGIAVNRFRMHPGPNFPGAVKIARYAEDHRFTLLHSHGYKGNILLGLLPRGARLPMVSTLHGWTAVKRFNRMKAYEWLDRFSLRYVDAVVLVHQAMARLPAIKGDRRIRPWVVNNGIPQSFDRDPRPPAPELRAFAERHFVIGAISRLSAEKGILNLVDALRRLHDGGRRARLLLIGEGEEREAIESRIRRHGLQDHVLLPGYLPGAGDYLALINVLAIPSLTEGLPITLLEAMRAGVPIVASRVGGIPHVVRHEKSALLVGPGDTIGLAKAIGRIHSRPELGAALGAAARRVFTLHYTSEQMALGYRRIYEAVVTEPGKRRQAGTAAQSGISG